MLFNNTLQYEKDNYILIYFKHKGILIPQNKKNKDWDAATLVLLNEFS